MAASKPQGILAKQPTRTTRLLSNDRTDLLFIIHASSSHGPDQTSIITLTTCGVRRKGWISALFFGVCFRPCSVLWSGKNVSIIVVNTQHCVLTQRGLYTWCVLLIWRRCWVSPWLMTGTSWHETAWPLQVINMWWCRVITNDCQEHSFTKMKTPSSNSQQNSIIFFLLRANTHTVLKK